MYAARVLGPFFRMKYLILTAALLPNLLKTSNKISWTLLMRKKRKGIGPPYTVRYRKCIPDEWSY